MKEHNLIGKLTGRLNSRMFHFQDSLPPRIMLHGLHLNWGLKTPDTSFNELEQYIN